MRAILVLVTMGLSFAPVVASAAEVSVEEGAEVDMVTTENRAFARVNESRLLQYLDFDVGLESETDVTPASSAAAFGLEAILALLAELALAAPALEPASEQAGVAYEEGAAAEAQTQATESQVTFAARAEAAGTTAEREERADLPPVPVVGGSLITYESMPDAEQEEAPPAPEAAPDPIAPAEAEAPSPVAPASEAVKEDVPLPIAAVAGIAIATVSGGAGLVLAPGWRSALVKLLKRFGWLGLFSRIAQEDILNHERRAELLEFVRNNPGERVENVRRALGFSNGSMHYHLRVLNARDLVRVHREGIVARLFPAGPRIQPAPYVPTIRRKYLEALAVRPGITQRELASTMGVSERMVSYHVGTLAEQGFVAIQQDGGRKRLFVQATPA